MTVRLTRGHRPLSENLIRDSRVKYEGVRVQSTGQLIWQTMSIGSINVLGPPVILNDTLQTQIPGNGIALELSGGTYRLDPAFVAPTSGHQRAEVKIASWNPPPVQPHSTIFTAFVFIHFQATGIYHTVEWDLSYFNGVVVAETLSLFNNQPGVVVSSSVSLSPGDVIAIEGDGAGNLIAQVNGVTVLTLGGATILTGTPGMGIQVQGSGIIGPSILSLTDFKFQI